MNPRKYLDSAWHRRFYKQPLASVREELPVTVVYEDLWVDSVDHLHVTLYRELADET